MANITASYETFAGEDSDFTYPDIEPKDISDIDLGTG